MPSHLYSSNSDPDTPSASVDPFLLDFGTSVNVNDDLRRGIGSEISELEQCIQASASAIQHELKTHDQVQHDLSHSDTELGNLSRGTSDQLESATVHNNSIRSMAQTLYVQLVQSTDLSLSPKSVVIADTNETAVPTSQTNKEHFQDLSDKFKKLSSSMMEASQQNDKLFEQMKEAKGKIKAIDQSIEAEGLEAMLQEQGRTLEAMKQDHAKEQERSDALKKALQLSRDRCGRSAQEFADKTQQLTTLQREYAERAQTLETQEAYENEKLSERKKGHDERMTELRSFSSTLTERRDVLRFCEEFEQHQAAHKDNMAQLRMEQDGLEREKEDLEGRWTESQHQLETAQKMEKEAIESHENALSFLQQNDDLERTVVKPGEEEITKLAKLKEELATDIGKKHQDRFEESSRQQAELKDKVEEEKVLLENLETLEAEVEGRRVKCQYLELSHRQATELWEIEIEQHQDLFERYRNAIDAEKSRQDQVRREKAAQCDKRIEAIKVERAEKRRFLDILLWGIEIIQNSKKEERRILGSNSFEDDM